MTGQLLAFAAGALLALGVFGLVLAAGFLLARLRGGDDEMWSDE